MIPLYTPQQVREMDARAIVAGTSGLTLMERAAGHLARAVIAAGGRRYGLRVGVLCGKGNNGGDGLAAARRLLDAGADPRVCLVGGADGLSDDAEVQLRRYRQAHGRFVAAPQQAVAGAQVAVDCLLGTGARGAPREPYADAVRHLHAARRAGAHVVACDVPTGVDADTGQVEQREAAVSADLTVTFGAHKRGLWLAPARGHCGRLVLGDLGLPPVPAPVAVALEAHDVAAALAPPRFDVDKRARGVVLVLAGSAGMSGAAVLVARGAMAAGAGLVTVAAPDSTVALIATGVPEATTLPLPADDPARAFDLLAQRLPGAHALVVGPGLGHDEATAALVRRLVREADVPLVLDADGINAYRHEGAALAEHATPLLVLTPHMREFARLVPEWSERGAEIVWRERATLVAKAARAWGAVLVAKGPGTIVSSPHGQDWVNPTGGPALATGGSGDVLAGVIGALVARAPRPHVVAAGVWVHGLAGELVATQISRTGATALDIAAAIPAAFKMLEEEQT